MNIHKISISELPGKIRESCRAVLKCKSKRPRIMGERRYWEDHYPARGIDEFISTLVTAKPHCNKATQGLMQELIDRKHLWTDKEASPERWVVFEDLVKKLLSQYEYL